MKSFRSLSASVWTQEFPGEGRSQSCADKAPKWLYRQLIQRRLCDTVEWRQVPLPRSNLGAREGSPGVFYKHGYVFIFGGWGFGPMRDLHVAALQTPMHFQEVMVQGSGPAPTYEAKTTVLEDAKDLDGDNSGVFQVIVTGGWRHGGLVLILLYDVIFWSPLVLSLQISLLGYQSVVKSCEA